MRRGERPTTLAPPWKPACAGAGAAAAKFSSIESSSLILPHPQPPPAARWRVQSAPADPRLGGSRWRLRIRAHTTPDCVGLLLCMMEERPPGRASDREDAITRIQDEVRSSHPFPPLSVVVRAHRWCNRLTVTRASLSFPPTRSRQVANLIFMYYNFTGGLQEMAPPVRIAHCPDDRRTHARPRMSRRLTAALR